MPRQAADLVADLIRQQVGPDGTGAQTQLELAVWTRQCRCRRGAPAAVLRSQPPLYGSPGRPDVRCGTVVAVISRFQVQLWADLLVLPIGLLPFVLFRLGINDSSRPPDSAQPDWLRAEEARRQASPTHDTEV
jgi:hypothetical protein